VSEKYCPPDSGALKTYLELSEENELAELSDEDLEREKRRLLKELEKEENMKKNAAKDSESERR